LLNPARALIAKEAENKEMANEFVDWLINQDGGQEAVRSFTKNGVVLYSSIDSPALYLG
jgi:ABC-type Fe3+ transport system substrate-binding protein